MEEPQEPPPPETPAAPFVPPAIGFHNPLAVRAGLLAAAIAALLGMIQLPLMMFWTLVRLLASGFFAVYIYQRRSGAMVTAREGARLGWITGIFSFLIATVLTTIAVAAVASTQGLAAFFREQVQSQGWQGISMEEALRYLETPVGIGFALFFSLVLGFALFSFLSTLGGIVGAKVLERD